MPETPHDNSGETTPQPAMQLALIGGLMLLIIAMLCFLWMRERRRRFDVQSRFVELSQKTSQNPLAEFLQKMPIRNSLSSPQLAVRREDLSARKVQLDGQSRKLFSVSVSAGERMGVLPGDVIEINVPVDVGDDASPGPPSDD